MSRKKEEEEKPPKGIELPFATIDRVYESVGVSGRGRKDELDKVLDDEEKDLAKELKQIRIKTLIAERKRELQRLDPEAGGEGTSSMEMLLSFMAQQGMSGEDAASFIKSLDQETIMKMGMMSGTSQGQNALLPLLLFSKQPQTTPKDIAEMTSSYLDSAMKLADKISPKQGAPTNEFMQLFSKSLDKMDDMTKTMYQTQISEINRKLDNVTKPEDYIAKVVSTAESLGFSRDHSGTQNLKVAEIEAHTTLEIEKMHQTHELAILAAQAEAQKWQALQQTFAPVVAVAAGPIMEQMRGLGRKTGAEMRAGQPQPPTQPSGEPSGGPVVTVPCKQCGAAVGPFQTPFPPMAQPVKCPSCGFECTFKELITPPPGQAQESQEPEPATTKAKLKPRWG